MKSRKLLSAALISSLLTVPVDRAMADAGNVLGGIVGGIVGGVIVNEANKNRQRQTRTVVRRSTISSSQRAENREVQTALNYFNFPAGTADGVLGRRSRAAVSSYQVFMGYPATGYLNLYEKDFLLNSYRRSIAGGYTTTQLASQNPRGMQGLLHVYRDQLATGGAVAALPAPTQQSTVVATQPQPAAPATPEPTVLAAAPLEQPEESGSALPTFMGGTEQTSLASHCNNVSLVTNTNGGFTTAEFMQDAGQALDEQFCLARTYAISEGETLLANIKGFSKEQIEAQCSQLGNAMKNEIAAVSLKSNEEVLSDVNNFVLKNDISPSQMSGTAKVCLSVGYRTDNMDVSVASSLLLVALGSTPYAELLGHHLKNGFGATTRPDLAVGWYGQAITALEGGATAVFAPGQPERVGLLRKAAFETADTAGNSATLPAFTISQ